MLLALSVIMLTSASFAWLTISRAPEVSQVATNVAANGNLEIALATGNGTTPPEESKVGDSAAATDKDVMVANTTWGNLVNLNDARYGLDNLVLRPAKLNTTTLISKPLIGAKYGSDGRINGSFTDFQYMSWVPETEGIPGYFGEATEVGIRAISSVKREMKGLEKNIYDLQQTADARNGDAAGTFSGIVDNTEWMNTLAGLLGTHMTATMNSEPEYKNATVTRADVEVLRLMYGELVKTHEIEAEAIAATINLQYLRIYGGNKEKYEDITGEYVLNKINTFVASGDNKGDYVVEITDGTNGGTQKIVIKNLEAFINDYKLLKGDFKKISDLLELDENGNLIEGAQNRQIFQWNDDKLSTIVEGLMVVDDCLMKKSNQTEYYTIADFSVNYLDRFGIGTLLSMAGGGTVNVDIQITNGVLYNLEQRLGTNISISDMLIKATVNASSLNMTIDGKINATVVTNATKPSYFKIDYDYTDSIKVNVDNEAGVATAEDTYAMVIDLWVRTNNDNSVLVLEGGAIIVSEDRIVTGTDENGGTVNLYTMTRSITVENEDGSTEKKEEVTTVYYKGDAPEDENGTRTWYNARDHYEYQPEEIPEGTTFTLKMETVQYVDGYEGENRIWNQEDGSSQTTISTDATTQGQGSCYIYYAETPEDQARSLELLKSLEVAFIDRDGGAGEGQYLATARMDTEHYFAENGRVIVPLIVTEGGVSLGEDETEGEENAGEIKRGITKLEKNEARKITAIVYLNGDDVGNKEVLSAANIQGQLNIQFGTDEELLPAENKDLSQKTRTVTASVDKTEFRFDGEEPLTVTVTVKVEGDQPSNLTAFFLRKISDTQGSKEDEMIFTRKTGSETEWEATYTFDAPGTYVLRTVKLDGQEYVLDFVPEVFIEGFTIREVSCSELPLGERSFYVMTGDNYYSTKITLRFASSEKMPDKVQGRFTGPDNSTIDVPFSYNVTDGYWTGNARFDISGEYKLQYVILDGVYEELSSGLQITADVKLGIKVKVTTTQYPTSFLYDETRPETLFMRVNIYDNANNEMTELEKVDLCYKQDRGMSTMDAVDLEWDGKYYTGIFDTDEASPGKWVFSHVEINLKNRITKVISSPTFEMISPDPPELTEDPVPVEYIYAPDGDAKMTVKIDHSETATVAAMITNGSETFEVQGSRVFTTDDGTTTTWNFPIPKIKDKQDGYWEMTEVRVWNYYDNEKGEMVSAEVDENGILVPDGKRDEPMVFKITDYEEKVVQTVTVTLSGDYSNDTVFGADESGNAKDPFMTEHEIEGLEIEIKDFEGQPIRGIGNIKLNLTYNNNSEEHGGYTIKSVVNFDNSIEFNVVNGVIKYSQKSQEILQYAGTYTTSVSFNIGSKTTTYTDNKLPTYTVKSLTPTVKITGADWNNNNNIYANGKENTFNNHSATVHFGYSSGETGGCNSYTWIDLPHSSVTMQLLNAPAGTFAAEMIFSTTSNDGKVYMYTNNTDEKDPEDYLTNSFIWNNSATTCDRWIGEWIESDREDAKTPAGLLKAETLVLTYNDIKFEIKVSKMYPGVSYIEINNPD